MSFMGLNKWYHTAYAWEIADVEPIEDIWHYDHPIDEIHDERIRYGY